MRNYRHELIKRAREKGDYTVIWLAAQAGVSTMQWWRLENGRSASLELVMRACELLDLDWRKIIYRRFSRAA